MAAQQPVLVVGSGFRGTPSCGIRDPGHPGAGRLLPVVRDRAGRARPRADAFLANGPAMLDLVLARTPVRFAWVPGYSDYYPEAPGGVAAGRSIEPVPFNGRRLGGELAALNPPYLPAPDGVAVTQADYRWLTLGPRHPRAMLAGAKVAGRLAAGGCSGTGCSPSARRWRRAAGGPGQRERAGLAGAPPLTSLEVAGRAGDRGPVLRDGGAGGGAGAAGGGARLRRVRAERVDAAQYQREPIGTSWTTGAARNTGDGILAGQSAGAAVGLMDDAWWGPSIPLPGGPYFCLAERSLPGCVLVNGAGQRFVNESAPYVDAVHAMYDGGGSGDPPMPAWLVFDQRYRDTYVFAGRPPGGRCPSGGTRARRCSGPTRWARGRGRRRRRRAGQDRYPVQRVRRSRAGTRTSTAGDSAYDRYYGDPRCRPNPNLAPLSKAPYYAVKIVPGDLGTKGGLRTDERAPGTAPGRVGDRRPVRGRQRERVGDGPQLRRRWRHHRAGHDVRLHRRPRHGRSLAAAGTVAEVGAAGTRGNALGGLLPPRKEVERREHAQPSPPRVLITGCPRAGCSG